MFTDQIYNKLELEPLCFAYKRPLQTIFSYLENFARLCYGVCIRDRCKFNSNSGFFFCPISSMIGFITGVC